MSASPKIDVLIVGGGPAGLRAAEVSSSFGARVAVFESNPFVGRKFLVAGKGGLNLTHGECFSRFVGRYRRSTDRSFTSDPETANQWNSLIGEFSPDALRTWADGLGAKTFQASTGRIYPKAMRAAQLLRGWIEKLRQSGVSFHVRHTLQSIRKDGFLQAEFTTPSGTLNRFESKSIILALGGASWPRTGSNAHWVPLVSSLGIPVTPLFPANCGWECDWPEDVRRECEGKPLKNICATAHGTSVRGELLVTKYGLEGGAIYALSHILREQLPKRLAIDFKPDSSQESLLRRLGSARTNFLSEACARWRLDSTAQALLRYCIPESLYNSAQNTVALVKRFPVLLKKPRPIEEAISTAGGVCMRSVSSSLMSQQVEGLFFAGEMLDWEAPTGGYLLQGCFSTGTRAGRSAARWALEGN